jgi:hypothetical protein
MTFRKQKKHTSAVRIKKDVGKSETQTTFQKNRVPEIILSPAVLPGQELKAAQEQPRSNSLIGTIPYAKKMHREIGMFSWSGSPRRSIHPYGIRMYFSVWANEKKTVRYD